MAYPDSPSNITLPGQKNLAGDPEQFFKDHFVPELRIQYRSKCTLDGIFRKEPITGSNSHTDSSMGRTEMDYQTARGQYLQSKVIEQAETTVTLDPLEYSKVAVDRTDLKKTQLLVEPRFKEELSASMAKGTENKRICEIVKTARSAHDLTSEAGGSIMAGLDLAAATTIAGKGELLYDAISAGVQAIREKDITDMIYTLLTEEHIRYLRKYDPILNKDYGDGASVHTEGLRSGIVGTHILVSNHANALYGTNVTNPKCPKHDVDMTDTIFAMFTKDAILELELQDNFEELIEDPDRNEHRIQVTAVRGYGKWDPRCALEVTR